jgi:regulator of replication initiation timing
MAVAPDPEKDPTSTIEKLAEALEAAREGAIAVEAEIQKKENEIQTASSIGEREISNLEQKAKEAQRLEDWTSVQAVHASVATRRSELADRVNQLEAQLGTLKSQLIEVGAEQTSLEARLAEVRERIDEETQRKAISQDQLTRAEELEKRLSRLEEERAGLVQQIEKYAPVVEAQREATTASGAAELSEAYAAQADGYKDEWQRWLVLLVVTVVIALAGGILTIAVTQPSNDASSGEIASRIAIEVLVLGLLVYAVRVSAHQFRVHRHLETVARGKAAALMTFNRLVAGPGEAEVRTAVAVALAQAVFDSTSTGFIDSSQDGVTIIERMSSPVAQRLSDRSASN